MGGRSDLKGVGLSLALLGSASGALAQVVPNTAALYLHPTDVSDARALWVNPAGLGRFPEASVHLDLTVGDPGGKGQLRQLTFGLNSRGLSLGYQRDLFGSGGRGHTYRLGYAFGRGGLAAGFATVLYRGGTSSTGWDMGVLYDWKRVLTVGGVIKNIGQPVVRGRLTSDGVVGYAFALRGTLRAATSLPISLLARLDTDRSLHRSGLAFGLSLGGEDTAGLVARTPGDASRIDALSLYGVSTRRFTSARRSSR